MSTSTFSYAQAAKRHVVPHQTSQVGPTATTNPSNAQSKDETTIRTASVSAPSASSHEHEARDSPSLSQADTSVVKQESETMSIQGSTLSSGSGEQGFKVTRENNGSTSRSRQDHEEKMSRSPSRASRSVDGDAWKGNKGKKARGSENDGDTEKGEEEEALPAPRLIEASVPAVNPWTQRKEAQAQQAKKPVPAPGPTISSKAHATGASTVAHARPTTLEVADHGDKLSRKPTDLSPTSDQPVRRNGPRGSRSTEDKPNGVPPAVADANLFPDLKSSVYGDVTRKPQDKTDRGDKDSHSQEDSASARRHKKEWNKLDFVPTVTWTTPIPPRPTKPRPARGGREVATPRGASNGMTGTRPAPAPGSDSERVGSSVGTVTTKPSDQRPRDGGPVRSPAVPTNLSKRLSTDMSQSQDARKHVQPQRGDVRAEYGGETAISGKGKNDYGRPGRGDGFKSAGDGKYFQSYGGQTERPHQLPVKIADMPAKDGSMLGTGVTKVRRPGGYPNRGGNHGNAPAAHMQQPYLPNGQYASHNPYPPRSNPNSNGLQSPSFATSVIGPYGPSPPRGGMSGGRQKQGRQSNGSVALPSKMPQAPNGHGYDYGNQPAPYSYPYEPNLVEAAKNQLEYYLSVDNLCKDRFLRSHMDSQGFVQLTLLSTFNRMKRITEDFNVLHLACIYSDQLDYVVGHDDIPRARMREKWNQFVLPMEERAEEARDHGPTSCIFMSYHSQGRVLGQDPRSDPRAFLSGPPQMYHPTSFAAAPEQHFGDYRMESASNGADMNGFNGFNHAAGSALSATVPEFSPVSSTPVVKLEDLTNFRDEDIPNLVLVTGPATDSLAGLSAQHAAEAAVEGTNGSSPQNSGLANGQVAQPIDFSICWFSGNSASPNQTNGQGNGHAHGIREPYPLFRNQALHERDLASPGETPKKMKELYLFWLQFLTKHFNEKIYEEFRNCALEDARQKIPSKFGLSRLLLYYSILLDENQPAKPWKSEVKTTPSVIMLHATEARAVDLDPTRPVPAA